MQKWKITAYDLELNSNWRIARETTTHKRNYIITIADDEFSGRGEVALSARFREEEEDILEIFKQFVEATPSEIQSLEMLLSLLDEQRISGALRFGIESAFIHYLSSLSLQTVGELLGVHPVTSTLTMRSIPLMEVDELDNYFNKFDILSFSHLKVKCDRNTTPEYINRIRQLYAGPLSLDFNEAYDDVDKFICFGEDIVKYNILFAEQPLPAEQYDAYFYLQQHKPFPIFADESLQYQTVDEFFGERFDGVNVKLMKAGGYIRAVKQLRDAQELGLVTMLGCRIESSLGISSAINLAGLAKFKDLDGHLFLKEDPFNLVFSENGRLTISSLH